MPAKVVDPIDVKIDVLLYTPTEIQSVQQQYQTSYIYSRRMTIAQVESLIDELQDAVKEARKLARCC